MSQDKVAGYSLQSFADEVSEVYGLDPMTVAAIIMAIIKMIQQCRKPQSLKSAEAIISSEVDTLLARRRPEKCPLMFRPIMRRNGVDRDDFDDYWAAIVATANSRKSQVAGFLVAA